MVFAVKLHKNMKLMSRTHKHAIAQSKQQKTAKTPAKSIVFLGFHFRATNEASAAATQTHEYKGVQLSVESE